MKLNLNIPDFERFSSDQQFVNVVEALERMEHQKGGLSVEEVWEMAWQVVEMLRKSQHPETAAKRLLTLINGQTHNLHSTHCVLFCVNYLLCANDEEPDPNQEVIDNISKELSQMEDIVELFEAVEQEEDNQEARGHKVKERNVLASEKPAGQGLHHELTGDDHWILSKLEELVGRGLWIGLEAEDVMTGLRKALALEEPGLNTQEMALSNKLWGLFRKRKGQDKEGSLRTTWLNIVGYCVRHNMIDGASPKLCKDFFPRLVNDEYKAIDKGKKGEVYSFKDVEPLLDTYLKPKNTK